MLKVLIVDDDWNRHSQLEGALTGICELYHAYDYQQAIKLLDARYYDVMLLDHDLQDFHTTDEKTGQDVCMYIQHWIDEIQKAPQLVVIHSWNPAGAIKMKEILQDHVENLFIKEFDKQYLVGIKQAIRKL